MRTPRNNGGRHSVWRTWLPSGRTSAPTTRDTAKKERANERKSDQPDGDRQHLPDDRATEAERAKLLTQLFRSLCPSLLLLRMLSQASNSTAGVDEAAWGG